MTKIFVALGTAPTAPDRVAVLEGGGQAALVSFFDYPRSYESLESLYQILLEKLNERTKSRITGADHKHGETSSSHARLHPDPDSL